MRGDTGGDARAERGRLTLGALAFRAVHAAIAATFLLAIAYVWWCALTGRRGRLLGTAVTGLGLEGLLVAANHGDCPLGKLQERARDPVPLFELVLSRDAARRAVPVLGAVAVAGVVALMARPSRPYGAAWTATTHRTAGS
jgi:hypothetical protein